MSVNRNALKVATLKPRKFETNFPFYSYKSWTFCHQPPMTGNYDNYSWALLDAHCVYFYLITLEEEVSVILHFGVLRCSKAEKEKKGNPKMPLLA